MPQSSHGRLLAFARRRGVLRTSDLVDFGVRRNAIPDLVASGIIQREGRGLYTASTHDATEKHSLALACKRIPKGVVCLLSALVFHGLTTQNPWEVWMAIDFKAHKPILDNPPLRIVRFSGDALSLGVEEHVVEGVPVRVYSVAKTVADLFKYRNKIGTDIAIEALREARRKKRMTMADLARFAKVCRVTNVIRPYVESLQ
jgi:predicted transcriptional regulator of viral defense system